MMQENLYRAPTESWFVIGTQTTDRYVCCDCVSFDDHTVSMTTTEGSRAVSYAGAAMSWGHKREAPDLASQIHRFAECDQFGGGAPNTTIELAILARGRDFPVKLGLVDLAQASEPLKRALGEWQVHYVSPDLTTPGVNLVVVERGRSDRCVLKMPTVVPSLGLAEMEQLQERMSDCCVMLVNSPKSEQLMDIALAVAARAHAPVLSVLTGSPSIGACVRLVAHSQVAVCNLAEFSALAQSLRVQCPSDEHRADPRVILAAIRELRRQVPLRALVITLGARGCITFQDYPRRSRHIHLYPEWQDLVRHKLAHQADLVNGVGDRWFASFVLHYNRNPACDSLAGAALWASGDAVARFLDGRPVDHAWFCVDDVCQPERAVA